MKNKNLIVFDIDGTLTDSVKTHQKVFTEALIQIGIKKINSEFKSFKHHTDSFISKEIYETTLNSPFSYNMMNKFENDLTEKITLEKIDEIPGAKNLIEKLEKETDFGVCYATGSLRRAAEYKLKSIGIEFNEIQLVASDNLFEREKIVEKAINNALKYYDLEKFEKIISIGDGLWDFITAKNLDLNFIGIGKANKEILIQKGVKIVYENFLEFEVNKL